ncbi:cold shock domain-containing protein [Actinoplanes sp. LDG1-06]|uniref:Cold shock domain-containing protein n=1 Tax=Paractinoplanes ovalisporus TaxID=2810368 RepID=A0ABS2AJP7_9ACTN|nr:cold shock domain-containing protein [Actinoplanes ovalisporus]MBM2620064.1 cold shock domain-containing protein [Actinoplanes ovalisporus]
MTTTTGTVRDWNADEGWGVLDSEATPGGCWAHFGAILADGYRALAAGQAVSFEFETADQDGYAFRAVAVWTGSERPPGPAPQPLSTAYTSTLHLEFD